MQKSSWITFTFRRRKKFSVIQSVTSKEKKKASGALTSFAAQTHQCQQYALVQYEGRGIQATFSKRAVQHSLSM